MTEPRQTPHDIESEQALLGCAILSPRNLDDISEIVRPENFYRGAHQTIFTAMLELRANGREIDAITLKDYLSSKKVLTKSGGAAYLIELSSAPSVSSGWKRYAEIVRKKAISRRLIEIGTDVATIGYDDCDDIQDALAVTQSMVMGIVLANQHDSLPVGTILTDLWKSINSGGQPYITPKGVPIARIRPGDLVVVGAGTSAGKTAITLDWCDDWSETHKVAYYEYEMTEQDLMSRLVCRHAGVTMNQVQDCDFSQEELQRVQDAMKGLRKRNLFIEEVWCDINILMAKIRKAALQGVEICVIDHLGLIPYKRTKGMNEAKAVGVMVTNPLKRLAAELGIKIVLLVQMNREGQKSEHFPKLYHLRDSGEIEQDASIVLMLWSDKALRDDEAAKMRIREQSGVLGPEDMFKDDFNLVRVGIEKNRNGALSHAWAKFHAEFFKYSYFGKDGMESEDRSLF
jgi:replicative DNA helicase